MGTNISTWYLVFIARQKQYWWDYIFCRGKYKHVCALGYDASDDQWYLYDWSFIGVHFYKFSDDQLDNFIIHVLRRGGSILRKPQTKEPYKKLCFPLATCVAGAKHLVKFKSLAFTPTQLFCAYTKAGAKRSFVTSDTNLSTDEVASWD